MQEKGTFKIGSYADYQGSVILRQYKEGTIVCGCCKKQWCIRRSENATRQEFARAFKAMGWAYTQRHGWICPSYARRMAQEQRRRKNYRRRTGAGR